MGGFAVDIDWTRPVTTRVVDSMLDLVPHRARGGSARLGFAHAALGEARSGAPEGPLSVTTTGRFSLVGDLRLWAREGLRSRAGGLAATEGLNDRQLILAAYARTGIGFLDDLDGDFAFVIWDDERQRALAVRDRFGVKPLFFTRTRDRIRIASQPKQLLATSTAPIEPCDRMVFEFLTEQHQSSELTFFKGIHRVRPADYVVFGEGGMSRASYWSPTARDTRQQHTDESRRCVPLPPRRRRRPPNRIERRCGRAPHRRTRQLIHHRSSKRCRSEKHRLSAASYRLGRLSRLRGGRISVDRRNRSIPTLPSSQLRTITRLHRPLRHRNVGNRRATRESCARIALRDCRDRWSRRRRPRPDGFRRRRSPRPRATPRRLAAEPHDRTLVQRCTRRIGVARHPRSSCPSSGRYDVHSPFARNGRFAGSSESVRFPDRRS